MHPDRPLEVLLIEPEEQHDQVRELVGGDAAGFAQAGAGVDQHIVRADWRLRVPGQVVGDVAAVVGVVIAAVVGEVVVGFAVVGVVVAVVDVAVEADVGFTVVAVVVAVVDVVVEAGVERVSVGIVVDGDDVVDGDVMLCVGIVAEPVEVDVAVDVTIVFLFNLEVDDCWSEDSGLLSVPRAANRFASRDAVNPYDSADDGGRTVQLNNWSAITRLAITVHPFFIHPLIDTLLIPCFVKTKPTSENSGIKKPHSGLPERSLSVLI